MPRSVWLIKWTKNFAAKNVNHIQDGPFLGFSQMEGKTPSPTSATHILQWSNLAQYTLPKEGAKNM